MIDGHRPPAPAGSSPSAEGGNPVRSATVDLSGDGRRRGEAHGECLRSEIDSALQCWRDRIASRHHMDPRRFAETFLASTGFVRAVEQITPDLHEEVAGIAAGSGQPIDEVWAYNLWTRNGASSTTTASDAA